MDHDATVFQAKIEDKKLRKTYIGTSLEENRQDIQELLKDSDDVVYRELEIGGVSMTLLYIENMINQDLLNDQILEPLMREKRFLEDVPITTSMLIEKVLPAVGINKNNNFHELLIALLSGKSLLLIDTIPEALIIESRGAVERGVEEPSTEQILRGSRESFVENIKNNIALIRKRIYNPSLSVEYFLAGKKTETDIAIVYLKDMAQPKVVEEIRKKLKNINEEKIITSSHVEQIIEEHKWSIFPQMLATERPDKVVGSILEGRIAIITNGTPFVLLVPVTIGMFFNAFDDYSERVIITSALRIMRYISYLIATTLPALYMALTAYHPGMLPTSLVLYITGTRVGLPFPFLAEILFMEFTLEALLEASVRLPKPVGQTIGIVGGLVIGQAVVQAGLVSPIVVIIVALTAITSFTLPNYTFSLSNRILRIYFIVASAIWGLYGIVVFWLILLIHLASIESFGIRYLSDFSPYRLDKLKDTLIKAPTDLINETPPTLETNGENNEVN
ncbi:hypothetical protein TZ02_18635 [Clostridium aceticum]|nr:hypothetical protein TZ02_18635 [Clostridium aceticum]